MYQVGDLIYFKEDDPTFEDKEMAILHAEALAMGDSPIGIWDPDTGELLYIAYEGKLFQP